MADWARLLSECWGLNLSRGFESRPPRHSKTSASSGCFCFQSRVPFEGRTFESRTKVCFATLPAISLNAFDRVLWLLFLRVLSENHRYSRMNRSIASKKTAISPEAMVPLLI